MSKKSYSFWNFIIHFTGIVPTAIIPSLIWLFLANSIDGLNSNGKSAINFQLNILLYLFISVLLIPISAGSLLIIIIIIYAVVMSIKTAVKAGKGDKVDYPYLIRFLK